MGCVGPRSRGLRPGPALLFATAGLAAAGGKVDVSDVGKKDFESAIGEFGATQNKVLVGASYKF